MLSRLVITFLPRCKRFFNFMAALHQRADHSENHNHRKLRYGIWSHHFMGNRWETVETASDFIFLGSKITVDGDCIHEIKRHLLLGRKVMTKLDSILKSRDISLPTKVHLVKAMVFPVVM